MFKNIRQKEFTELTNTEDTVVLDVRTDAEYMSGSLPKAINIDAMSADFQSHISQLDKSKTYLVYCRSGARSASACFALMGLGFDKIYNLGGGIMNWN